MEIGSVSTLLKRSLDLICKLIVTVAIGAFVVAFIVACMHFQQVRNGIREAERLLGIGLYAEASAKAESLQPWAQCFPGRSVECMLLRVQALVRSGQSMEATRLAETIRTVKNAPVPCGGYLEFRQAPLAWLQKVMMPVANRILSAFCPVADSSEWSGYRILFSELVSKRDLAMVENLASNMKDRFPGSTGDMLGHSAKCELKSVGAEAPAQPDRVYSCSNRFRGVSKTNSVEPERPNTPSTKPCKDELSDESNETTESDKSSESDESSESNETDQSDKSDQSGKSDQMWGIVTNVGSMAVNPKTGLPLRELKPGDVLVIEEACSIHGREAFKGALILSNRNVPDLAFRKDVLTIMHGAYEDVSPEEVALRSRLAEIAIQERALQSKADEEDGSLTPQQRSYRQALDKAKSFKKDVSGLEARLNKATGSERMKILDKLRQLKYQEQTLMRDLQKKKEAAGNNATASESEPQLRMLQLEKQAIEQKLKDFVS